MENRAAWRNEVCAPELLTLDENLVSDLLQQVENQQEIVDDARYGLCAEVLLLLLYCTVPKTRHCHGGD